MVQESAPVKINLYLRITGRRDDGYHLLDSLVVFADIADALLAERDDRLALHVTGPFAAGLANETDNLVTRAARALARETGVTGGARLTLTKNLPIASGVGGGSADAAATLRALCRLWDLSPDPATLGRLALSLGADVPVCLLSRATRMAGIGEILTEAPVLPDCAIALVNPGVAVATPAVFKARHGPFSSPAALPSGWPDAATMARDLAGWGNDLAAPAQSLQPIIQDVIAAIAAQPGCLLARMSGSGATCFGLFASRIEAETAAAALGRHGWWARGGVIPA